MAILVPIIDKHAPSASLKLFYICKHVTCTAPHRPTTQDTKRIIIRYNELVHVSLSIGDPYSLVVLCPNDGLLGKNCYQAICGIKRSARMCSLAWGKVLFDPPWEKSYCPFCEGPLFGTGVTGAPLSGYAKPDECSSCCPLRTH